MPDPLAGTFMDPDTPMPGDTVRTGETTVSSPVPPPPLPTQRGPISPETADALAEFQLTESGAVDPEVVQQMSPEGRDRLQQTVNQKAFDSYVYAPEPYSPAVAPSWQPTTESQSTEAPANIEQIAGAYQDAAAMREAATTAAARLKQEQLQSQLVAAQNQRQQLQERVNEREADLAKVEQASEQAKQRALAMRERVRAKQVDSGRLFREAPFAAAAAILADFMYGLAGQQRAGDENSVFQLVQADTERQRAEIDKLGLDAENALADVAIEFDGDLDQAQAALNIAKTQAIENAMVEQAAAAGLQQLPAEVMAMFAKNAEHTAAELAKVGDSAKIKTQQAQRYDPGRTASGGGAPSLDTMTSRAEAYNKFRDAELQATTGKTREERAAEAAQGSKQSEKFPELVEKYGTKRSEMEASDRQLAKAQERYRQQVAKYGTVPGLQYGGGLLPVEVIRQIEAQFGMEAAQDAQENRRIFQQAINSAVEANKGAASEGDVARYAQAVSGSGTLEEKLRGINDLRSKTQEGVRGLGGAYGRDVVNQYEQNRRDVIGAEPDIPQPRGTYEGKFSGRQQELLDILGP